MNTFDNVLETFWGGIYSILSFVLGRTPFFWAKVVVFLALSSQTILIGLQDLFFVAMGIGSLVFLPKANEIRRHIKAVENAPAGSVLSDEFTRLLQDRQAASVVSFLALSIDGLLYGVINVFCGISVTTFLFSGACYLATLDVPGGKSFFARAWAWIKSKRPRFSASGRTVPTPT